MSEYNQQNQRPSISTSVATFWDENGIQLRVSYLENGVSIAFWTPQILENGSRKYPPEMRYGLILNNRILSAVMRSIINNLLDDYRSGKEYATIAVFTNAARTTIFQIEMINGEFYVKMHQNVDPTTNIPGRTISFKFETYPVMTSYDPASGNLEAELIHADFFLFTSMIKAYLDGASGMVAGQGVRQTSYSRNRQLMDHMIAIAKATHAALPAPQNGYQYNHSQQNNSGYQNQSSPQNSYETTSVTEVADLQDLV